MNGYLDRRSFLLTSSALAVLPFTRFAHAAREQLTARVEADIGTLDPGYRVGSTEGNIIRAVCQTLAYFKPGETEWTLDAAKSITKVSDTEFEFELNPGQTFSDGYGEMTAEDVKYSFDRFIQGDQNGNRVGYADDLAALERVEVTGKYTGRLILKNPSPALWLIGLGDASGAILSKKAVEELGDGIATKLVGSGPYSFKEWRPKEQFVLEANPDYRGSLKPHFPKVVGRFIAESRTAALAFQAGELDFTEIDGESKPQVEAAGDASVIEVEGIDYTWIGINVEKGPLADIRVRQAIRLGVDVEAIIAGAYSGIVGRANSLLAPALLGHWAEAPVYQRDVEKAKALLAEAGQSSLSVTFTCVNDAESLAVAQIVQANLAEIGVNVTINAMDSGAFWAMGTDDGSKDLELTLVPYTSKFDPGFQTQWFVSSQVGVWNWQRWKNEEFDRLHAEGAATMDPAKRAQIYVRMQQLLDESASCIWITHGKLFYAHRDWLKPFLLPNGRDWHYERFTEASA